MNGVRPKDVERATRIKTALGRFVTEAHPLPGIDDQRSLETLVAQIVESLRRQEYFQDVAKRTFDGTTFDPNATSFNPYHYAVALNAKGQADEALWLVFLAVYFGKHQIDGWSLLRNFYGRLGQGEPWTYHAISANGAPFREWIETNVNEVSDGRFGNHRKYATVLSEQGNGLAQSIESFLEGFGKDGPASTINSLLGGINDPTVRFEQVYGIFKRVHGFGRLGAFDIATTLCQLGIINGSPGHPYLAGATGPLAGARLVLTGNKRSAQTAKELTPRLVELMNALGVDGQVVEDALCNWQKSPRAFVPFR